MFCLILSFGKATDRVRECLVTLSKVAWNMSVSSSEGFLALAKKRPADLIRRRFSSTFSCAEALRIAVRRKTLPMRQKLRAPHTSSCSSSHEHPVVPPQVSHFRHVPFRTMVKLPHSGQASPT